MSREVRKSLDAEAVWAARERLVAEARKYLQGAEAEA